MGLFNEPQNRNASINENNLPLDKYGNEIKLDFQKRTSQDILEICQPFFNVFNAGFFSHTRAYHNGQFASLMTDTALTEYYLKLKYPIIGSSGKGLYLNSGFYVASQLVGSKEQEIQSSLSARFNIGNLIYVVDKQKNHDDMFFFGIICKNGSSVDKFINNMDMVKHFILCYKDKSIPLIKKVKTIEYAQDCFESPTEFKDSTILFSEKERATFFKNMILKKARICNAGREICISKREYECLKYITRNCTIKEIAKLLSLSPRTIETYFNSLKNKFLCENKTALLEIVKKNNLL